MRRFLLDTGPASDYIFRRNDTWVRTRAALARGDAVGISIPVLGELWAGLECSATRDTNLPKLIRGLRPLILWPFDNKAAKEYGRLFAILKRKGLVIPQVDIQTAAIAFVLGNCTVVTKDKHFSWIPGLKLENWAKP